MANRQIVDYLKKGLREGFSENQLKRKLFESGWSQSEVNSALQKIHGNSPGRNSKKTKTLVEKNQHRTNNTLLYLIGAAVAIIIIILVLLFSSQKISSEDLEQGTYETIKKGKSKKFSIGEDKHTITLTSIQDNKVEVEIRSDTINVELETGKTKKTNLDDDNYYELELKAEKTEGDEAEIYIKEINEKICTPEWECTSWSPCDEGTKVRDCIDQNNCSIETNKPKEFQECEENCEQKWTCSDWGECLNGTQTRECTDQNNCGKVSEKPETSRECETNFSENCSELGGNLCNSSAICNGTELNSSEDSVCCNASCTLNTSTKINNFTEQAKEYCGEEDLFFFNNSLGLHHNKTHYCGTLHEYTPDMTDFEKNVTCCGVKPVRRYEFSGDPNNTWNSLESSGECNSSIVEMFENCKKHKCETVYDDLYMGILGEINNKCHYYKETHENTITHEKDIYCKFNETIKEKMANCSEEFNFSEEDSEGSMCQIEISNALETGICQTFLEE